jgi:hypothetical protein
VPEDGQLDDRLGGAQRAARRRLVQQRVAVRVSHGGRHAAATQKRLQTLTVILRRHAERLRHHQRVAVRDALAQHGWRASARVGQRHGLHHGGALSAERCATLLA